ncbi:MAG: ATP phosphoribosyltransferase regulatory subunit, partial [Dehalococcoidales bacterium]|nr:ATP phosphoribosyltransferase regulatory subunit [Dehalococcoidales bacterium]
VANVFIFEQTGKETRERWQCGAELIGMGSPLADVELIMLALAVLKGLNIGGIEVRLSHAGVIRALLAKLGLSPGEQAMVFDRILDGDAEALDGLEPGRAELGEALSLWLNLKGESSGFLKNLKTLSPPGLPELEPGLDDFINIVELLESLGCNYRIDIASGRGFEYYTGVIFQLFLGDEKIGGGGRYDALIPLMGGSDIPASGFALYLDRLMELVAPEVLAKPPAPKILIRVEPEAIKQGFSIASCLRDAGYVVELYLGGQESANLRWTLDVQAKAPLFILTDQVSHNKFKLQTSAEVLTLLKEKCR